ncbi:hypothetical protein [Rhodococcus qingshengii]|uniref:hypothetical protein n=1 Tax=Rhodococcus qingshengii TaxID=334542 RepID=UPI0028DC0A5D|nr:hypothetical protein [uncultured Rhodococcus sp.]
MEYLKKLMEVPFENLYPDPNNPRLGYAVDEKPGYEDADALFDDATRERILTALGESAYQTDALIQAIIGQGWMAVDNIITWDHPDDGIDRHVVVEGNRRLVSLHKIRTVELEKQRKKLARLEKNAQNFPAEEIDEQRKVVARIEQIKKDTDLLQVVPVDANTVAELNIKLPRVLAVRHINGAKEWGNYAEDLWLLERYNNLFEAKHGSKGGFWDSAIIADVADEASLTKTNVKRQLKAASWFGAFRARWEDELPKVPHQEFDKEDYYLFELISRKPWVRAQLAIGEDDRALSAESEKVLFDWVFKQARPWPRSADKNPNIFYRHENIKVWDDMQRYDKDNGTSFASAFDVSDPDSARRMAEVEAEWLSHKANRKPQAIIDDLLKKLSELTADRLATEGTAIKVQLERMRDQAQLFLKMIESTES